MMNCSARGPGGRTRSSPAPPSFKPALRSSRPASSWRRLTVVAPIDGQVLQVDVRPGEFVAQTATTDLLVLGNLRPLHVRVDIDEVDIPRFVPGRAARGFVRGYTDRSVDLEFVRVEPYVIPKKSLTGSNTERVDTRVLQVIFAVDPAVDTTLYVGQQLDVFIDAEAGDARSNPPAGTAPEGGPGRSPVAAPIPTVSRSRRPAF